MRSLLTLVAVLAFCGPAIAKDVVELKRGHGMLAIRVVSNRPVFSHAARWTVLVVRNAKSGKKYRLVDRYYGRPHSTYFVESLPPGEYQAFGIETFGEAQVVWNGTKQMVGKLEFPREMRFRIEAGRLTNLETLTYIRPYYPADTLQYQWIVTPDADLPRRVAYLLEPDQAAALTNAPLGWTSIHDRMRIENLTTRTREASMFLAGLSRTADGGRLVGENFGQVARRGPQGSWSWENTGDAGIISGVVEAGDGSIYAVAENATLLHRDAGGHWQRIDMPYPGEITCSLEAEPDGSLLMAWENRSSISVIRYSPGNPAPWKVLRTIDFSPSLVNMHIRRCVAFQTKASLMVVQQTPPLTKGESSLDVMDRATGQWSHYPAFKLEGATAAMPDGSLMSLVGPATEQKFQVSGDYGKSWEVRATLSGCGLPAFRTSEAGFAMCSGNSGTVMWRTLDGGRSWERHADVPAGISTMVLLEEPEVLFIHGAGKLFLSRDGGKTSTLERDSTTPNWW